MTMIRSLACVAFALAGATGLSAADIVLVHNIQEFEPSLIEGSTKTMIDAADQGGRALHFEVPTKPEFEWNAQTWVRPVAANIAEGDIISITFSARSLQPATGIVSVSVGLGDAPYTAVLGKKVELTSEWKDYEITGPAKIGLTADQARFGFVYGFQAQTFEIAKLSVVNKGK